jgi:hypothetical protein
MPYYLPEHLLSLQDRINAYLDGYHGECPHLSPNMQTPNEVYLSHLT